MASFRADLQRGLRSVHAITGAGGRKSRAHSLDHRSRQRRRPRSPALIEQVLQRGQAGFADHPALEDREYGVHLASRSCRAGHGYRWNWRTLGYGRRNRQAAGVTYRKKTPKSLQATVRFAVEHSYHSQLQPSRERSWIWIPKAPRAMFTGSLPRLRWILELNGSVAIASRLLEVEPERNLQRVPAGEPRSWAPFGGC